MSETTKGTIVKRVKGLTRKGGKKNRKFGRNKKGNSNLGQALRSAKNKRLRIERGAEKYYAPKILKKPHGTARAARRFGMGRKAVLNEGATPC